MGKQRAGIRAHAHKSGMSQTQLTGKTYHEVQRYRRDHVHTEGNKKSCEKPGQVARGGQYLNHRKQQDHDPVSNKIVF